MTQGNQICPITLRTMNLSHGHKRDNWEKARIMGVCPISTSKPSLFPPLSRTPSFTHVDVDSNLHSMAKTRCLCLMSSEPKVISPSLVQDHIVESNCALLESKRIMVEEEMIQYHFLIVEYSWKQGHSEYNNLLV